MPILCVVSARVHSRYHRRLADLPIAGRRVMLMLRARRFRCDAVRCGRRIFAERFDDDVLRPWARHTARLDQIILCLALALGGRPAASFARRLSMPVSNDTLLRAVRRRGSPSFAPPAIIGIDDWAWRRNHRYGTPICDLERRKTIALLPDRELATAEAWLTNRPQIAVVARDRGGGYAIATQKALPKAALRTASTPGAKEGIRRPFRRLVSIGSRGLQSMRPQLLAPHRRSRSELASG